MSIILLRQLVATVPNSLILIEVAVVMSLYLWVNLSFRLLASSRTIILVGILSLAQKQDSIVYYFCGDAEQALAPDRLTAWLSSFLVSSD